MLPAVLFAIYPMAYLLCRVSLIFLFGLFQTLRPQLDFVDDAADI